MVAKAIHLYWWREKSGAINFGDDLSPIIVEYISGHPVAWASLEKCDLMAVGSLVDRAVMRRWKRLRRHPFRRIAVWGSGSLASESLGGWHRLDIRAVRGPGTRDALKLPVGTPMGDPALLLSDLIERPRKRHRWGIIPHVVDQKLPAVKEMISDTPGAILIDLGDPDVLGTATKIAECEFVASSSLHGIIAADALGVPNLRLGLSNNIHGADWKFRDYFDSVGRTSDSVGNVGDLIALEDLARSAGAEIVDQRKSDLRRAFSGLF